MKATCITEYRGKLEKGKEYDVEDKREQEFETGKKRKSIEVYKFVKVLGCRYQEKNFTFA